MIMRNKIAITYALSASALALITMLTVIDLVLDWPHALSLFHFVVEIGIVFICFGLTIFMAINSYQAQLQTQHANSHLENHLQGLSQKIDAQLREWGLTRTEYNTAILLIKGLSHKEIAAICGRGERTVRQHAVAVYRKSGVAGRAQLSAFFMEDLLPPVDPVIEQGKEETTQDASGDEEHIKA